MDSPISSPTKTCPNCGTRIAEDTPKCLVCGTTFEINSKKSNKSASNAPVGKTIKQSNTISISAPVLVILLFIFLAIGAALVYGVLNALDVVADSTETPTETQTATPSLVPDTPLPTGTNTPQATFTPVSYFVKPNDTCLAIAAAFDVSIQSIILQNNLSESCPLFLEQELKIPHPTITPIPLPTSTLTVPELTREACTLIAHVVQEGETMSMIVFSYAVPQEKIMEWNNLTADIVFVGQKIDIPTCEIISVGGSTVTPSPAPEYQAPELLLPRSGDFFDSSQNTVSLQWASIGEIRENEFYQVTVIDITSGSTIRIVAEVKETEYNVPIELKPKEDQIHVYQWYVVPVAQIGVRPDGTPIFILGGPTSDSQIFSWAGQAPEGTPGP